jgi:hypothetical protein
MARQTIKKTQWTQRDSFTNAILKMLNFTQEG